MKKKIIISVSVILAVFIVGLLGGITIMYFEDIGISTGHALISSNSTVFLVRENTPIRLSSENVEKLQAYETGDKLLVVHSGVAESYPAVTKVLFHTKIGNGSESDISQEVISSLSTLGWTKKEAENEEQSFKFSAQYIRTGLPIEDIPDMPIVTVIKTLEELNNFTEDRKKHYGTNEDFIKAVNSFNEEFFKEKALIFTFLEEGSGSISHKVEKVVSSGENELSVYINRVVPEVGTCDMAYHYIITSLSKEDLGEKDIRIILDGKDASKKWEEIKMEKDYANFSLMLPEGWDYTSDENVENNTYGISIFNEEVPDKNICIEFTSLFGVCGTGLSIKDITLGNYKASMGIYDSNPSWDYIVFNDTPGYYVIYNNTDGTWWNEYGDEAMEILNTIKIAEGIIFREEAVAIASKEAEGEYERKVSEFDHKEGIWTITFTKEETEQQIKVNTQGGILTKS
ncbi:MAG: hypothetical protein IKL10_05695 [Clostridia bacterium]|nr:hypothetical protein [Clostridia bacterium]